MPFNVVGPDQAIDALALELEGSARSSRATLGGSRSETVTVRSCAETRPSSRNSTIEH